MRIAVEGCCHGELDNIYATVAQLERENNFKIDLLLICGDFQGVRNFGDFNGVSIPPKYHKLMDFYKYYNKEKTAPVLTIVVGGNHEASGFMQELPYGGWMAPNIYYLGYAGVVTVGGLRIGGISGIFKGHDYNKGHYERPPYTEGSKRSAYHIRSLEVYRLKQISRHVDVFMSHDWPRGIYNYGDVEWLKRKKSFFTKEIDENTLGCEPLMELLSHVQPSYWFAAHLHVKFAAHVLHQNGSTETPPKTTKFLALDKCLPRRNFLQVLEVPHKEEEGLKLKLDAEWLTILRTTNHLLTMTPTNTFMPAPGCRERYDFKADDQAIKVTKDIFGDDLMLPENFVHTAPPIMGRPNPRGPHPPVALQVNPQTSLLCTMLDLTDPNASFLGKTSEQILNESFKTLEDSGEDVVLDEDSDVSESDASFPSCIDSSMDVSTSSALSGLDTSNTKSPRTPKFGERAIFQTPRSGPKAKSQKSIEKPSLLPQSSESLLLQSSEPSEEDELQQILSAQKRKSLSETLPIPRNKKSPPRDDEDELHSIMEAQKQKSLEKASTSSSSEALSNSHKGSKSNHQIDSSCDGDGCVSSTSEGLNSKEGCCPSILVPTESGDGASLQQCPEEQAVSSKSETDDSEELQSILKAQKSSQSSPDNGVKSSNGSLDVPSLSKTPASFGMSLLRINSSSENSIVDSSLNSSSSEPDGHMKRSSSEFGSPAVTSTPKGESKVVSSSSAKRLKRRNVSMYAEGD